MKKLIFLSILLIASIAIAHDFTPTAFTSLTSTKSASHVATGAKKVQIYGSAAGFYSYTTVTGTGATTNRYPFKAETDTLITIPQNTSAKRLTFSGYSAASVTIYVAEEK